MPRRALFFKRVSWRFRNWLLKQVFSMTDFGKGIGAIGRHLHEVAGDAVGLPGSDAAACIDGEGEGVWGGNLLCLGQNAAPLGIVGFYIRPLK